MDIIFVVDSSGSIRDTNIDDNTDNWKKILNFIVRVIDLVLAKENADMRFAVVTFSNEARLDFDFKKYGSNYGAVIKAVLDLPFMGYSTNTTGGLLLAERELIAKGKGGNRPNARDLMILITDGENTGDPELLLPTAAKIRNESVSIMGVGVTYNINENEILSIISNSLYYFKANNFDVLSDVAIEIASSVCYD